jgi:hypothetical protein
VPAPAGSAFPGDIPVELGRTFPALVFLRAVAACNCCLALGSYVAVVLALKALLHLVLSLISLALKDLALLNQTLINNLVSILRLTKLNNYARGSLYRCAAC